MAQKAAKRRNRPTKCLASGEAGPGGAQEALAVGDARDAMVKAEVGGAEQAGAAHQVTHFIRVSIINFIQPT